MRLLCVYIQQCNVAMYNSIMYPISTDSGLLESPALTVESVGTATVTVALSSAAMRDVVVHVATDDGTAQGG